MAVRDVNTSDFATAVLERSHQVPVVVDFWAEWCGPCKVLGPTLERLAAEANGDWELAKVDVDSNQQLAMQFGIQGIPTVIGFKDGQPVARFTGALPDAQVRQFLEQLTPSEADKLAAQAEALLGAGKDDQAERLWRQVLASDPGHIEAGVGLAGLLLERDEAQNALEVLERLPPTEEVRRLQAAARLTEVGDLSALEQAASNGDPQAKLEYGKGLAAAGRHPEALQALLELVEARDGEVSEQARQAMVDLFDILGSEHALTVEYRRKLASALF